MTTRTGKIARLPLRLRNRLNLFLMDGKPASLILDWINVEPEAVEVFNAMFGGRPVSPQNLSEWRQGGYQEWLATRECRLDADAFCESSQILGNSGIRADHILVFLTARWAKLIQQWGVMDPTQFSFAKHNLADLTKSAALLKKLELQTMRSEMDRERLKFLLRKKGGQPGDSDYSERDAEPPHSPFHRELTFAEKLRTEGGISTAETHIALTRLHEHPGAPESEGPFPEATPSPIPNPQQQLRTPETSSPQATEGENCLPAPHRASPQQPGLHRNPVVTTNSPRAAVLPGNHKGGPPDSLCKLV